MIIHYPLSRYEIWRMYVVLQHEEKIIFKHRELPAMSFQGYVTRERERERKEKKEEKKKFQDEILTRVHATPVSATRAVRVNQTGTR